MFERQGFAHGHLIGMYIEMLSEFHNGFFAPNGSMGHFSLKLT